MQISPWSQALVDDIADRVVFKIRSELDFNNRILGDRLTFDEKESAAILGVPQHVLKGCRERGEINVPKIGKKYRYSRDLLVDIAKRGI